MVDPFDKLRTCALLQLGIGFLAFWTDIYFATECAEDSENSIIFNHRLTWIPECIRDWRLADSEYRKAQFPN